LTAIRGLRTLAPLSGCFPEVVVILPLAVLTQLSTACAPQVAPQTLAAIAQVESQRDPLAIGDNTAHRSYRPRSKTEAVALAQHLIAAGHNIDAGITQINRGNWAWLGLTAATVFDPCQNLRAAATVLTAFSAYHTGSPTRGMRYAMRVVANTRTVNPQTTEHPDRLAQARAAAPAMPSTPPDWNVFPDTDEGR
jgi:type IV secretion system protein VirB1